MIVWNGYESEINLYKAINLKLHEIMYYMRDIKDAVEQFLVFEILTFLIMVEIFIYKSKLISSIVNWKIIIMCINSQVLVP